MKPVKILGSLWSIISFILIPETSFANDTLLKCVEETYNDEPSRNLKMYIIKLDNKNQTFEIRDRVDIGSTQQSAVKLGIQGKANYLTNVIEFRFEEKTRLTENFINLFEISRKDLTYSNIKYNSFWNSTSRGNCKVIPALSTKKNLI